MRIHVVWEVEGGAVSGRVFDSNTGRWTDADVGPAATIEPPFALFHRALTDAELASLIAAR